MMDVSTAKLKVELINVGHGDSLLLHWIPEDGDGTTILIDGGPSAAKRPIEEALQRVGATRIDLAVLSHCDADHVDGLLAYVESKDRLPIHRYWGPCVPAFRRHDWLFPSRIKRGLDQTDTWQNALGVGCTKSWPLEGTSWISRDGDLVVKVLSPAARLIERLLLGEDSLSLFLEHPTPLGWLLTETSEEVPIEDRFGELRSAISTGEIAADTAIENLPSTPRWSAPGEFVKQGAEKGIDPEFFGNSVLNDTSIVLLIEVRLGEVHRRLLFTGDLQNFTYLMARHSLGLACDVVKAPHHGSHSFVDRDKAYDAVWQWLRPRAVLVSANGKHGLPRNDFRDAVLRYGATLFCTSRRSREIVVGGPTQVSCCNIQYACNKSSQAPVSLSITASGIITDGIACARGNLSGVMPVIEVRQHIVEPSPILTTLAETEVRKHTDWVVKWLRKTLCDRRNRPVSSDLQPVSLDVMQQAAVAVNRFAAAAEMEVILERAAREGKVWLSRRDSFRDKKRLTWLMPDSKDEADLRGWVDKFDLIQLAVKKDHLVSAVEELLYVADTGWLAKDLAENLLFPCAMFEDVIWPKMVAYLMRTRTIGVRTLAEDIGRIYDTSKILVLFRGNNLPSAAASLAESIKMLSNGEELQTYLEASAKATRNGYHYNSSPPWPAVLMGVVTPLSLDRALPPSGLIWENCHPPDLPNAGSSATDNSKIEEWVNSSRSSWSSKALPVELAPSTLAATLLSGFDIVNLAKQGHP